MLSFSCTRGSPDRSYSLPSIPYLHQSSVRPEAYNALPSPTSSISSSGSNQNPLLSTMPPGEGGSNSPPSGSCELDGMAQSSPDGSVSQALEIARESPDGAQDPYVSKILEGALDVIWKKVQAHPNGYVMTRDEFAVFNFFQHRFAGDQRAVLARKRYWDNMRA